MSGSKAVLEAFRNTVAFNLKAIEREIADYEVLQEPSSVDELRARAMGAFYAGFYQQAQPLINALVALEPTVRNIVKLAQVEQRLGHAARAISIAQRTLVSSPECFPACEVLADSLLETGEFQQAASAATRALQLEPDAPRMKAVVILAKFALSSTKGPDPRKIKRTGDSVMDAVLTNLFTGGVPSDSDVADIVGRFSERELGGIMARVEPMA